MGVEIIKTVTFKKENEFYTIDTKNEIYKYQSKGTLEENLPLVIDLAGITKPYENYYFSRKETSRTARELYVIEYVKEGAGYIGLHCNGPWEKVQKGDLYIISKGYAVTYFADKSEPFEKLWFNISGKFIKNLMDTFAITSPVLICHMNNISMEKAFENTLDMLDSDISLKEKNYNTIAFLTNLFIEIDRVSGNPETAGNLYQKIINYIDAHIFLNVGINDIADYFFISRCSLYRIFKTNCGIPPKQYLLEKKIEKAKALLISEKLNTAKIAEILCFCDKYHFCRIFKQITGRSPSEYRSQHTKNK